jgi:hypothetical protein
MSKSQNEIIPYVIMISYPELSHIHHIFSSSYKGSLNADLLEQFVDFMYSRIDTNNLNSVKDIADFWINWINNNNNCTSNSLWSVMSFINNRWVYTTPTDEVLFEGLIKERARRGSEYISSSSSDEIYDTDSESK